MHFSFWSASQPCGSDVANVLTRDQLEFGFGYGTKLVVAVSVRAIIKQSSFGLLSVTAETMFRHE